MELRSDLEGLSLHEVLGIVQAGGKGRATDWLRESAPRPFPASVTRTGIQGERAVQTAQVLKTRLHGAGSAAKGRHRLRLPVDARVLQQPSIVDPVKNQPKAWHNLA